MLWVALGGISLGDMEKEDKERPLSIFFLPSPLCPSSVTINQHDRERKPLPCILNSLPATGGGLWGKSQVVILKAASCNHFNY